MKNQHMPCMSPAFAGQQPHQIPFDTDRIVFPSPSQPLCNTFDMRVNHNGRSAESNTANHIGRFTPNPRQLNKSVHSPGNPPLKFFSQYTSAPQQMTRLIAEKPGRSNQRLNLPHRRLAHGLGVGKTIKQRGRYLIDPLIGTLGGENGRNQQLPGGLMTQRTMGVPVGIFQRIKNPKNLGAIVFI